MKKVDAALFDPPRAGAPNRPSGSPAQRSLGGAVGVSCNPATFARDASHTDRGRLPPRQRVTRWTSSCGLPISNSSEAFTR